jgi:hypothetical protein
MGSDGGQKLGRFDVHVSSSPSAEANAICQSHLQFALCNLTCPWL